MILHDSRLVTVIQLVDRIPLPSQPDPRRRGHPLVYSDRLFLNALFIIQTVEKLQMLGVKKIRLTRECH